MTHYDQPDNDGRRPSQQPQQSQPQHPQEPPQPQPGPGHGPQPYGAQSSQQPGQPRQPYGQPPRRRSRFVPWLIAAVVVLALCCGGGATALVLSATGDDESSDGDGNAGPADQAEAGINEPVRDGDFEFTVTEVETGVESLGDDIVGEQAQGQFALVAVTVENIGDDAQTFDGSSQRLFDTEGREHSHASVEAALHLEGSEAFLNEINPGNTVEGTLVFDIPDDAEPDLVRLHDSPFSNGVLVDLTH